MRTTKLKILSAAIVGLIVVGIVLGLYVANARSTKFARTRAKEVLEDSAREQVATLSAALDGQLSALSLLAETVGSGLLSAQLDVLMKNAENNLDCGLIFITDARGVAICGSVAGSDFSGREYVKSALSGETGMQAIKTRETGQRGVALSVPCSIGSGEAGTLCGVYFSESLSQLLSSEAYGGDGYSYIITSGGEIIIGDESDSKLALIKDSETGKKNQEAVSEFIDDIAAGAPSYLSYEDGTHDFIAVSIPFESPLLPEIDWSLVNVATKNELKPEFFASRANSVEAMAVFGVFTLAALILFLLLRHDMERRLNTDNETLTRLINDMPGGFLRIEVMPDGSGEPIFFNDNFCRLMSIDRSSTYEALSKTDPVTYVHPEDAQYVKRGIEKMLTTGKSANGRFRLLNGGGDYHWFTVYGGVSKSDERVFLNLYYTDATDKIEAYERYKRVVSDKTAGMENEVGSVHLNITRNLVDNCVSPYPVLHRFASEGRMDSFISEVYSRIPVEEDQNAFFTLFSRASMQEAFLSGKNHLQLEHRVVIYDEYIWIRSIADMLKNPDTGDLEAMIYAQNVNNEHKLGQLFSMVVDADYDFIIAINVKTGNYKTFVKSGGATTVFKNEGNYELSVEHICDYVHPDDCTDVQRNVKLSVIKERLVRGERSEISFRITENGQERNKKLTHLWLDGSHQDIIAFRSDVTQLIAAQERQREQLTDALSIAERANSAKTDFLSSMSHDIRTPMNAIVGMTDIALEDADDTEQVLESLQIIKQSSAHLLTLINDILDMSRIESGKMVLADESFSMTRLFNSIVDMYRVIAESKGLELASEISIEHGSCIGDKQRISRIADNLVGNAMKFTPAGGSVTLKLRELPSEKAEIVLYELIISDTGIGMSKETLRRIYEPFFRSDNARANSVEGSGLGLPIVKSIIDLIGGSMDVWSEQDVGTTFTVHIPLRRTEKVEQEPPETIALFKDKDLAGMRILMCEDNVINQLVVTKLLERFGAEVTVTDDGQQGYDAFLRSPPGSFDVILMDIQMPIMNGYEATAAIRASDAEDAKTIPIIAMTANAFVEDVHKSLEAGMDAHLTKPVEPEKLYEEMARINMRKRN